MAPAGYRGVSIRDSSRLLRVLWHWQCQCLLAFSPTAAVAPPCSPTGLLNTYYNLRKRDGQPVRMPACSFGPLLNFVGKYTGGKVRGTLTLALQR
jgi:hypothetical protein